MKKVIILTCILCICITNVVIGDETIQWYVDGVIYETTSCITGANIVVPVPPTKTGYAFDGWVASYNFSTLNKNTYGNGYYAKNTETSCKYINDSMSNTASISCQDSNLIDLSVQEWKVLFSYGTVYGTSLCSITTGTFGNSGTPDKTSIGVEAKNCWCKLEGIIPNGSNLLYEPLMEPEWLFVHSYTDYSECQSDCSALCGYRTNTSNYKNIRTGLFV